jgi:hypothetical protein
MEIDIDDENRFWSWVLTGNPNDCWEWQGCINDNGYGIFWYKVVIRSHRFSYLLNKGPIENGLCVCHKCDNPSCVNPEHLFLGTQGENMKDMMTKGRAVAPKGENHSFAKLTESQVKEIREKYASGNYLQRQLCIEYNISQAAISAITRRKIWKDI